MSVPCNNEKGKGPPTLGMLDGKVVHSLVMWVIIRDSCTAGRYVRTRTVQLLKERTTKTEHTAGPVKL